MQLCHEWYLWWYHVTTCVIIGFQDLQNKWQIWQMAYSYFKCVTVSNQMCASMPFKFYHYFLIKNTLELIITYYTLHVIGYKHSEKFTRSTTTAINNHINQNTNWYPGFTPIEYDTQLPTYYNLKLWIGLQRKRRITCSQHCSDNETAVDLGLPMVLSPCLHPRNREVPH